MHDDIGMDMFNGSLDGGCIADVKAGVIDPEHFELSGGYFLAPHESGSTPARGDDARENISKILADLSPRSGEENAHENLRRPAAPAGLDNRCAFEERRPPGFVVAIPLHGFSNSLLELHGWRPAKFVSDLGCVK